MLSPRGSKGEKKPNRHGMIETVVAFDPSSLFCMNLDKRYFVVSSVVAVVIVLSSRFALILLPSKRH